MNSARDQPLISSRHVRKRSPQGRARSAVESIASLHLCGLRLVYRPLKVGLVSIQNLGSEDLGDVIAVVGDQPVFERLVTLRGCFDGQSPFLVGGGLALP